MKAGIFFAGSGPILALTSCDSFLDPRLIGQLREKAIRKFIVFEVPVKLVQREYGSHFDAVMNDSKQRDELRVVDFDGHHVFYNFSFGNFGPPIYFEDRALVH